MVGRWDLSPYGAFADAMVERTAVGHRLLLAPTQEVADFVAATYVFDEVRLEPVTVDGWRFTSTSLTIELEVGDRTALGRVLRPCRPGWPRARLVHGDRPRGPGRDAGSAPRVGRRRPARVLRGDRPPRGDLRPRPP